VFHESCLNYLNFFCLPVDLGSSKHYMNILLYSSGTLRELLLHEDPYVPTCIDHIRAQHDPDMNIFRCMKTRVHIQLQCSSLANLILSLRYHLLCYITVLCPMPAAHIHVCCSGSNDFTPHHDRYHFLNLIFNDSKLNHQYIGVLVV
jgi:hypothetical protein